MKQIKITTSVTNRETESFQQYLKEIAGIQMFTEAEELVCSIKASKGDVKAREELVKRNLRFVVSVAKQYVSSNNSIEDLVNEGNIGLIKAAEKFSSDMNVKFISYAVWWVQKIILEYLANNGRTVRLPVNKLNSMSKLNKKINYLEQRLSRNVDISEIITEFGDEMAKENLELLDILTTYNVTSLDKEINNDEGSSTTLGDLISDDSGFKPTDNLTHESDIKIEVNRILNTLKPRDKRIIIALFGLDGNPPMTLKEIGDEIGVTREMIRQIKEKTLKKIKARVKNSTINSY